MGKYLPIPIKIANDADCAALTVSVNYRPFIIVVKGAVCMAVPFKYTE